MSETANGFFVIHTEKIQEFEKWFKKNKCGVLWWARFEEDEDLYLIHASVWTKRPKGTNWTCDLRTPDHTTIQFQVEKALEMIKEEIIATREGKKNHRWL